MFGEFTYMSPKFMGFHVGKYTVRPMDLSWDENEPQAFRILLESSPERMTLVI